MPSEPVAPPLETAPRFDIAIIGGGINGAGIARDAAGRGYSVALVEQHDLGGATSAASTKLIHGGLRYLEYHEFRLVREALKEREVLWAIAPHIIWPLRFVLPYQKGLRPAWLIRLGLFLYDHIGGRKRLPATRGIDLRTDEVGKPLKPKFVRAFEYSDCWVEDSRLVILNARDAADRGAYIMPRTRCVSADRHGDGWELTLESDLTGERRTIEAGILVNAAGPWVGTVVKDVIRANSKATVRLVQGSHIVVRRLFDHDRCYFFQNTDGRIFFAIPYERDYTLIGTTDRDYEGDPGDVRITEDEINYLCRGASEYFKDPIHPSDVVWSYSGVRPLYDDGASKAQAATREYVLTLVQSAEGGVLLNVFGGKITTYRRLAEAALAKLAPHLPARAGFPAGWTALTALPGGDFPKERFDDEVARLLAAYRFLEREHARRLVRAYGTKAHQLLGTAQSMDDLGAVFGKDLTEAEIRYLAQHEWAMQAEDVVWRRTKLGLRLNRREIEQVDEILIREQGRVYS